MTYTYYLIKQNFIPKNKNSNKIIIETKLHNKYIDTINYLIILFNQYIDYEEIKTISLYGDDTILVSIISESKELIINILNDLNNPLFKNVKLVI